MASVELQQLLGSAGLAMYIGAIAGLGAEEVADLNDAEDSDLLALGMSAEEVQALRAAVASRGGASPGGGAPPAASAPGATPEPMVVPDYGAEKQSAGGGSPMPDRTSTGAMLVQGTAVGAQPQQPMQPMQPMQTQFGAVPGAIPQQMMPMQQQQHYGGAQPVQHYGGAQVHQVATFTPQVAQVTSMKWDGGLCECFDDMEICLIGWLCSCVMYGQTKERAGTGDCCCAATGMAVSVHVMYIVSYIAALLTFGLGWFVSMFIFAMIFGCWLGQGRSDIQGRLGLEDEGNNQLCYGLWCFLTCGIVPHLALCQEARAVKQRWLANGQQPLGPPIVPMAPASAQGYAQPGQYAAMG